MTQQAEILNTGLEMALEWGENFGKPIGPRLAERYPSLSEQQLNDYGEICKKVKSLGFDLIYELYPKSSPKGSIGGDWRQEVLKQYPWVSEDNLSHIYTQGCYYAWRDFG